MNGQKYVFRKAANVGAEVTSRDKRFQRRLGPGTGNTGWSTVERRVCRITIAAKMTAGPETEAIGIRDVLNVLTTLVL